MENGQYLFLHWPDGDLLISALCKASWVNLHSYLSPVLSFLSRYLIT